MVSTKGSTAVHLWQLSLHSPWKERQCSQMLHTGIIQLARSPCCETCIAPRTVRSIWPLGGWEGGLRELTVKLELCFSLSHSPADHGKGFITGEIGTSRNQSHCLLACTHTHRERDYSGAGNESLGKDPGPPALMRSASSSPSYGNGPYKYTIKTHFLPFPALPL